MIQVSASFGSAIEDYEYLQNRAYSVQRALELVGNHYQLSKEERLLLFRGIRPVAEALALECRLLPLPGENTEAGHHVSPAASSPALPQPATTLLIDGYNVLYTIISYLSGKPVFIANDGLVRDIGDFHGRTSQKRHLTRAMELLVAICCKFFPDFFVHIFLDAPISESASHKSMLETMFAKHMATISVELLPSADYGLVRAESGILCTSDSAILGASNLAILDIARLVLENTFESRLEHITDLRH